MILVLGSTGTVGSAVLHELSALGVPARALVRARPPAPVAPQRPTPARLPGVEYVTGDAGDPAVLRRALRGVEQVFLLIGNSPAQEAVELGVVAEAAAAGVRHVVKVSAPVVGDHVPVAIARMHTRVERALAATRTTSTFLRPYAFHQNLLRHADTIRHTGTFVGITGGTPMNMVDARDIAAVAVAALTRPGVGGRALVLTGAETVSYPQVAEQLTALGAPTTFVTLPPHELREGLELRGMPPWLVEHVVEIQQMTLDRPERPTSTVADVTGHAPRGLDAFLREHLDAFLREPAADTRPAAPRGRRGSLLPRRLRPQPVTP